MFQAWIALFGSKVSVLLTKPPLPASATLKECRRVNTMKLSAKQLSLFPQSVGPAIGIPWLLFKNTVDTQPRLSFHHQQAAFLRSFECTERLSINETNDQILDLLLTSVTVELPILATLLTFSPSASLLSMFISDSLTIEQLACVSWMLRQPPWLLIKRLCSAYSESREY